MAIKIALILSVILQFGAAIIALSLIRRTRANIAWWLISLGFLLMAFRRVFDIEKIFGLNFHISTDLLSSWVSVVISLLMLISLAFVRRIFNLQRRFDELRKENESRILSAIIRTEESERQHFSKELHDGLGPLLSSVKMAISATRSKSNNNDKVIANAEKLIDESISTIKEISNKLSPHVLNSFGLYKAVKSFISKIKTIHSTQIKLSGNIEGKRYAYNIEVVLYRVICELITNTLQHARAKNCYIEMEENQQNILTIKYIDDGIGFKRNTNFISEKGMGFSNIQTRIKSINGEFELFSEPGEGIRIVIAINISE
ncbi:MAG TPA: histidine kinase [Prolixibacteraceae bacterium]|nr:histidine kinase [Prolixibacteraceae bacterium]